MDLIEAKNTGIPKAARALANNGSPTLRFEMGAEREYVTVIVDVHPDFLVPERSEVYPIASRENVKGKILTFLAVNPMSGLNEICKGLGYESIVRSVRLALKKMLESGELTRVGKKYAIKQFDRSLDER